MTDRRLVIAWPGEADHQQYAWSVLQEIGLASSVDFCQQINPYGIQNKLGFPDHAEPRNFPRIMSRAIAREIGRDWHPTPPTHAYINHEPHFEESDTGRHRHYMHELWVNGPGVPDVSLFAGLIESTHAGLEQMGISYPKGLSVYGIPRGWADRAPQTPDEIERFASAEPIIKLCGWCFLNLYPRPPVLRDGITSANEHEHFYRVRTAIRLARGRFRREAVPFLWPTFMARSGDGYDGKAYIDTYSRAAWSEGSQTLGLWLNLHTRHVAEIQMKQIIDAAESLRAFVGGV